MKQIAPQVMLEALGGSTLKLCENHYTGPPECRQRENEGSVSHLEGAILAGLARRYGGPVLEIGADLGISTRYIHDGMEQSDTPGPIWSVDVLHKWNRQDERYPWRRKVNADSREYVPPEQCVWAFVDGDHRYAGVQADAAQAITAGCTMILFHDCADHCKRNPENPSAGSDAREAVPDFFKDKPDWTVYEIPTECGLMLAVKE